MRRYGGLIGRRLIGLAPGTFVTIGLIQIAPPTSVVEALSQVTAGLVASLLGIVVVDGLVIEEQLKGYREDIRQINSLLSGQLTWSALSRTMLEIGSMEVGGEQFNRFYLNLLWSIERSYLTTFVATETSAAEGHNRLALEIQRVKIRVSGVSIRRLFVFVDDGQLQNHKEMMRLQSEAGIDVRYMLETTISNNREFKELLNRLGTIDFGVIDGKIAMNTTVSLSDGRPVEITRSMINCDPTRVGEYQFFFSLLWEQSNLLGEQGGLSQV